MRQQTFLQIVITSVSGILILLSLAVGCQIKNKTSVVIPDTHDLQRAITCQWDEHDQPSDCVIDPSRVTIDLGYLREIIDLLDACRKKQI